MSARRYGRGKFEAHPDYIKYMEMVVDHPHYTGMPNAKSEDGHINWQVSSGKTTSFYKYYRERFNWWVAKADSLGLPGTGNSGERFTIAARTIHPTGWKPCRLCGKQLNVGYFYLNYRLAQKWNSLIGQAMFKIGTSIDEAISILMQHLPPNRYEEEILRVFPERASKFREHGMTVDAFTNSNCVRSAYLSPGYMCNPPDRLDGFHDYGLCCRKKSDPGRSDENLRSYSHDRRTFMWWAEGDWMVTDALYNLASAGTCAECGRPVAKVSPDHVGPLSCGFKQIPFFRPLCSRCNSSKNRRMSASDVHALIGYEQNTGDSVASWQVRGLWDANKDRIQSSEQAKILSTAMRTLEDYYLRVLYSLDNAEKTYFLVSLLSPESAFFDVEFVNLDPTTFTFDAVIKTERVSTGRHSLADRIIRIAFGELQIYSTK